MNQAVVAPTATHFFRKNVSVLEGSKKKCNFAITMKQKCLIWLAGLLLTCNVAVAQLQWRELPITPAQEQRIVDVEITGKDGVITVRTPRRITVRVFTILGQNVSMATLNPGVSELRIGARGIYIVKVGNLTQKVAL